VAQVAGIDVLKDPSAVRARIGLVFQDPSLDGQLTGRENLDFHAYLYGLPASTRKQRIDDALSIVELTDRADSTVLTYSGGMRRRLEIARGILHYPQVLFLDEPTLGLDPQTRNKDLGLPPGGADSRAHHHLHDHALHGRGPSSVTGSRSSIRARSSLSGRLQSSRPGSEVTWSPSQPPIPPSRPKRFAG